MGATADQLQSGATSRAAPKSLPHLPSFDHLLNSIGGLVVSMLASGTQDRGFDPGRSRRIFRAKKIHSMPPLGGGEVKPSPMSQICAACQRPLGLRGSRNHRQN